METMIAVLHIITALILISLILIQDSKSGSLGGAFGGGGSNSVLGATGATTLAQKATRIAAVIFAVTCMTLSVFSSRAHRSVIDDVVTNAPAAAPLTGPNSPAEPSAPPVTAKPDASPAPAK